MTHHELFVRTVIALAIVIAGAFLGAVAAVMSMCAGDGPEFPY